MSSLLEGLNENQRKAVIQTEGPLMVLAGAGSGKTRTLVSRIIYLISEKKVSPFKLLAVTFSNKAAMEMRERVAAQSKIDNKALQITTFHAFCASVLRSESKFLGLSKNFTIYDDSESRMVVKAILGRRGINLKEVSPYEVLNFIAHIKNQGYYEGRDKELFDNIDFDDPFFGMYEEYEREVLKSNAVDFGGLITGVLQLFNEFPKIIERYRRRFEYILVDEYQDTNRAQFELITLLAKDSGNVCVVGDEDQSIYSWRGADIRNILDFEQEFPKAQIVKLEQNYRSSKNIIDAASYVIAKNSLRKGKNMWTDNDEGRPISIQECVNDKVEAQMVVKQIKDLIKDGVRCDDIALFYRNNYQSRMIEDALRKENVPYRIVGGIKFYERKEIKDLLAYLRCIINPKDSLAISRVINVPARGIGPTSLRKLEDAAIERNFSLLEVIHSFADSQEEYGHLRLSKKITSNLIQFSNLIREIKILDDSTAAPSDLLQKAYYESGYEEMLKVKKDYESLSRQENIEELYNAIVQFEESVDVPTLSGFLETITLDSQFDQHSSPQGEVCLMTVHGAKGLEFPYVFLVGAEENLFPSYKSLEGGEESIEEERRLFYVAMTRAMKELNIFFAQGRMLFGNFNFNGHSRFLDEIPSEYYHWDRLTEEFDDAGDDSDDFFSQDTGGEEKIYRVENSVPSSDYRRGILVNHQLYGNGKVVQIDGQGEGEKITIMFDNGAKKKFMVKFAPISIL